MITLAVKIDWPLLGSILLATCFIAWLILEAIKGAAEEAKKPPAEKTALQPDDGLRVVGVLLILVSLAYGAYTWLTFETTVETATGKQVINFSLQHAQTLRLGGAGLGVLCGVILAAMRR